jgi:hypothetical protein
LDSCRIDLEGPNIEAGGRTPSDVLFEEVEKFALNWYRDTTGRDITVFHGLSLGTTLSPMIRQACSSILGYKIHCARVMHEGKRIELTENSSRLQRLVFQKFAPVEEVTNPAEYLVLDEQKISLDLLRVPRTALAVRIAQGIFKFGVRKHRRLYITDWTTYNVARSDPDGRVLYRRSFVRTAIPRTTRKDILQAEQMYPERINNLFSVETITEYLNRSKYNWTLDSVELIANHIQTVYSEIREALVLATAQVINMLNFYKPSEVVLPADAFETFIIYYQLCRQQNVSTLMYVDGYQIVPMWPVSRTIDNSDWLPMRIAAFGPAQVKMLLNMGLPLEKIDLVDFPLLNQKITRQSERFQVIVMTWTPRTENPSANKFSPPNTLVTVLRTLKVMGISRVGVKLRYPGEFAYVQNILSKLNFEFQILEGRLHDHLGEAELFIGGISTALAECASFGRRYIVYEPYENGYTDYAISHSVVINRESISRTPEELLKMVQEGRTSWIGNPHQMLRGTCR